MKAELISFDESQQETVLTKFCKLNNFYSPLASSLASYVAFGEPT